MPSAIVRALLSAVAPPACAVCGDEAVGGAPLCDVCGAWMWSAAPIVEEGPPGVDLAVAAAPYEEVARDLAHALKYRRRVALAAECAALIAEACPPDELDGTIVPVPPSPLRWRWRGFDPAEEIAVALSLLAALPMHSCLRRRRGPRQVGRDRIDRLSDPPRVEVRAEVPESVLLVDDVHTTGATLSACASALRAGGTERVVALTLARSRSFSRPLTPGVRFPFTTKRRPP